MMHCSRIFENFARFYPYSFVVALVAFTSGFVAGPACADDAIQVQRYDDADDFLPMAERRNKDGIRLLLKQQDGEELFKVRTPRNVIVDVVAKIPQDAVAGVVLLIGGTGVLSIVNDRLDRSFSFQPRSRDYWWANRYATFLVDAPSDRLGKVGLQDTMWRSGPEHKSDLQSVLDAISKRFTGPLVIYGHSDGAISLANIASLKLPNVRAYVLSSPAHDQPGTNILQEVEYGAPVLIFQHTNDSCSVSNSRFADRFLKSLKASSKRLFRIDGGSYPISGSCGPFAPHSFFGVEKKTIDLMASEIANVMK